MHQRNLPQFKSLGANWAESEAILNYFRSGLYKELDFIGFTQYDKENKLVSSGIYRIYKNRNLTERINKFLNERQRAHISLETHSVKKDYRQRILADLNQPNTLVGTGTNCYDYIIDDYNRYFKTSFTLNDLFKKSKINLCSSFIIDIRTFEKMMTFFSNIVESGKLLGFDAERKHRLQGGLAERYFGVFLAFEYTEFLDLSTIHHRIKNN